MRQESVIRNATRLTNRWLHEVLPDGSWRGSDCIIVGGGPSLESLDWDLLESRRTIGINRAYEAFEPTMVFSMDTKFLNQVYRGEYGAAALERFLRLRSLKVWLLREGPAVSLPDDILIVKQWHGYQEAMRAFTFSMVEGIGHGNNSGYAALNLAVCLGANPIYLLGFDMAHKPLCHWCGRPLDGPDPKHPDFCDTGCFRSWADAGMKPMPGVETMHITHWHEGHSRGSDSSVVVGNFTHFFDRAAPAIRTAGFEVVNLNPDSKLGCFPKKRWQEVLQ